MMKKLYLLFSFCLIIALSGCSAPDQVREVSKYLDELGEEEKFSGVVLIAKDGEPILEKAYGIANRNYDVPNQLDTKFNLGSINKMFTAVAILQLVEQGRLSLDDRVIDHLPKYPNPDVANNVTIHHLLTHTSGMGDFISQEWRSTSKDVFKEHDDYLPLFVDHPLQSEPGTRFSYSNAGFILLGIIIEEITEKTYYDYIRENIYQPCDMMETDSYEADRVVANLAVGYAGNIRNYGDVSTNFYWLPFKGIAAGSGYSTAGDMLKLSNCLLDHQLLNQELTETLMAGKVVTNLAAEEGMYAYGFIDSWVNDHRIVGHGGNLPGACANLDIFVDLGYTAIVLSNSTHDCLKVKHRIREILLN